MFQKLYTALLIGAAGFASPVQAQEILQLAPATPWSLDYADDSCQLVRTFGSGDEQVMLGMTAYEPGGRFQITAVGALTQTFRTPDVVQIALGDLEDFHVRYLQVDFGGQPGIIITNPITIGPLPEGAEERLRAFMPIDSFSDPDVENQVTTIGFVDGFEQEFVLQTGSLQAPMQALKECNSELLTHWDIDVEAHADLARVVVPRTPPFRWIEMRAYPREMRQPMLINFRLIVDAAGDVAECHVAGVEPDSEFARLTCEQLEENASFDPALDANGEAVRSYFVSWRDLRG